MSLKPSVLASSPRWPAMLVVLPLLGACDLVRGSTTLPFVAPDEDDRPGVPGPDDDDVIPQPPLPEPPPFPGPGCGGASMFLSPAWDGISQHVDGNWFSPGFGEGFIAALHTPIAYLPGMGELTGAWSYSYGVPGGDIYATTWSENYTDPEPIPYGEDGQPAGCPEDSDGASTSEETAPGCPPISQTVMTVDGQFFDSWGGLAGRFTGTLTIDSSGYGWGETTWQPILGGFWAQMSAWDDSSGEIYGSHWWNTGIGGEMFGSYFLDGMGFGWGYADLFNWDYSYAGFQDGMFSLVSVVEPWVDPATGQEYEDYADPNDPTMPDDGGAPMPPPGEYVNGSWFGTWVLTADGPVIIDDGQVDPDGQTTDSSCGDSDDPRCVPPEPEPVDAQAGEFEASVWSWSPGYAEVSGTYFAPSCGWVFPTDPEALPGETQPGGADGRP